LLARPANSPGRDAQIRISTQGISSVGVVGIPRLNASSIVPAINFIESELRCHPIGTTFFDTFTRTATLKPKAIPIGNATSADITVSWRSPSDIISVRKLGIESSNKRVKIARTSGRTWVTLHLTDLRRGKLHFKLFLKQMASVLSGSIKVTTQVATYRT
ncbi:MAG: hypothetical protein ACRDHN_10930, partial [Thermomicrobiales bacterium]